MKKKLSARLRFAGALFIKVRSDSRKDLLRDYLAVFNAPKIYLSEIRQDLDRIVAVIRER